MRNTAHLQTARCFKGVLRTANYLFLLRGARPTALANQNKQVASGRLATMQKAGTRNSNFSLPVTMCVSKMKRSRADSRGNGSPSGFVREKPTANTRVAWRLRRFENRLEYPADTEC